MPLLGDITNRGLKLHPDEPALLQGSAVVSHSELHERADRVAGILAEKGVGVGERVMIVMPNDLRFPELLLGIVRHGAVAIPANIKLPAETLAYIAADSDTRLVFAHESLAGLVTELIEKVPGITTVMVDESTSENASSYEQLIRDAIPVPRPAGLTESDPALLMYTSGSTGRPKGCVLTHRSQMWQAEMTSKIMMLGDDDRALAAGPLYHANAFWVCLLPMLWLGGSVAILEQFGGGAMLDALDRLQATYSSGTPAMLRMLVDEADRRDSTGLPLDLLLCGSSSVPPELLVDLERRFGCDVVEGYGLTEGGANVTSPRWGVRKEGSSGIALPGVELRIVDPDNPREDVPTGESGELWTRSPANTPGYHNLPEVTAEKLTPEGWIRTGDLARRDEDGYLWILGRVDDMINCGGENVYPKEVESLLISHPAVKDASVVPVPHAMKGEAPIAWVATHRPVDEEELRTFCLERGPAYAHPRKVFFTDEFPVTGTQKVDRNQLIRLAVDLIPGGMLGGEAKAAKSVEVS